MVHFDPVNLVGFFSHGESPARVRKDHRMNDWELGGHYLSFQKVCEHRLVVFETVALRVINSIDFFIRFVFRGKVVNAYVPTATDVLILKYLLLLFKRL